MDQDGRHYRDVVSGGQRVLPLRRPHGKQAVHRYPVRIRINNSASRKRGSVESRLSSHLREPRFGIVSGLPTIHQESLQRALCDLSDRKHDRCSGSRFSPIDQIAGYELEWAYECTATCAVTMSPNSSRRSFLKSSTLVGAGCMLRSPALSSSVGSSVIVVGA